jgi:hypothetical protein
MIDNFRNHSDDWSQVPSLSGRPAPIRLTPSYVARVPVYTDDLPPRIYVTPGVSVGLTYVLWLFFGLFGVHYFYMGKPGVGVLYLLTGGLLGVGWFIDLFTIKGQVARLNRRR